MPPLDLGNGLVAASFGTSGAWLSLGAPHPQQGFVELNGLPRFEPGWRGDPDAVRRYRGWMAEDAFAFLQVEPASVVETVAVPGAPCVVQRLRAGGAVLRFRGRLDAHPLAEITETDPPPASAAETRLVAAGDRLLVEASALPARAEIAVRGAGSSGWTLDGREAQLTASGELEIACTLHTSAPPPGRRRRSPPAAPVRTRLHLPPSLRPAVERLAERAREYVLGCCAMRVGEGEVCLLTDHRILPLSWTRDAYWQAALLLAAGELDVVADHLRWLWGRCERPDQLWSRSHQPYGAVKDRALQADQQLYPVLELADYRRAAGRLPDPPGGGGDPAGWWPARVRELWEALPRRAHGLLRSDETPADDRAEHPYPLSGQLLHWQAATRLAELGVPAAGEPAAIRARVARHFAADGPHGRQWAYEVDGRGGHRLYQDANDLPTAFAPLTGFCRPDDPLWAATMRFAFSPHNPARTSGPFAGLGSVHTPGTWTLGDLQEWVAMSLLGEPARAARALERLVIVAGDGLLPEAYDAATGGDPVRRWFAWPGATLAALVAGLR